MRKTQYQPTYQSTSPALPTMRNVTLHTFSQVKSGALVVDYLRRENVEDDQLKSLQFVFHIMEKTAFIGAVKKMTHTRMEYTLDDAEDYSEMLLAMHKITDDLLLENSDVLLTKIEAEVERA